MFDRILLEIFIIKSEMFFGHENFHTIIFHILKKLSCCYERFGFYSHLKFLCFVKFPTITKPLISLLFGNIEAVAAAVQVIIEVHP